jgi:DNA-binding beta-propeller fold protein YncE
MARRMLGWAAVLMVAVGAACGGGDGGTDVDPGIAPFVGTWDADSLTVTNAANDTVVANVLDFGSFFITVEPSGQYTATLTVLGQANPEIGQLSIINGSTLSLTPTFPAGRPAATATYVFQSEDYLILDGTTDFDFNQDGTPEAAFAHFELQRQ